MRTLEVLRLVASVALFASCASDGATAPDDGDGPGADLPLGDVSAADMKADGEWGSALDCKPLPNLPVLPHPQITLSIDGLTLHLVDTTVGFDKIFPVGPGQQETDPTQPDFGESLSYYPIQHTGQHEFSITPDTIQPCKTWWTDPATLEKVPVFAGLPFLSFYGNYAIHGPIDNYRAPNGGTLRRGYVSHGCFRMEAADILEVYARIKGVAKVPVHVQREPEKRVDGSRVDLAQAFVGSVCRTDGECNFAGGFCSPNKLTGAGFCSARCTQYCPDKPGRSTFCVADPNAAGKGMCVPKLEATHAECRPFDSLAPALGVTRFNQATVAADVCQPGSRGWVGDKCLVATDCGNGTTCAGASAGKAGVCTMSCNRFCADQPGYADTFCSTTPALGAGGSCLRQCTPGSNASECGTNQQCQQQVRFGDTSGAKKYVCVPKN